MTVLSEPPVTNQAPKMTRSFRKEQRSKVNKQVNKESYKANSTKHFVVNDNKTLAYGLAQKSGIGHNPHNKEYRFPYPTN